MVVNRGSGSVTGQGSKLTGGRKRSTRYGPPLESPLSSLTPAARRILNAAAELLANEGYAALTYERIAEVAGVNKSSIRYNFGSKSALVAAVVDAMSHDMCVSLSEAIAGSGKQERIGMVVNGLGEMISTSDVFTGYFRLLPHILTDPDLREKMAALYDWWNRENAAWFASGDLPSEDARLIRGIAQLVCAAVDGLAIQAAVASPEFDLDASLEALTTMLQRTLSP
jgi:AcrR family transcriptional regulator